MTKQQLLTFVTARLLKSGQRKKLSVHVLQPRYPTAPLPATLQDCGSLLTDIQAWKTSP